MPIFCTLAVIAVQLVVSIAVIGYFNRIGRDSAGDWWKTMLAPALGALAQAVVIFLLLRNLTLLAGADVLVIKLIPVFVAAIAAIGYVYALWLRSSDPGRFETIGQLHDDELEEIFVDEMYVDEGRPRD